MIKKRLFIFPILSPAHKRLYSANVKLLFRRKKMLGYPTRHQVYLHRITSKISYDFQKQIMLGEYPMGITIFCNVCETSCKFILQRNTND
jgi:hypothetical protein